MLLNYIAVAIGGAMGAMGRYAISMAFIGHTSKFPIATFCANALGCLLMGLGFVIIVEKALLPEVWRCLLLVGGMGALTTFSTFSLELFSLVQSGHMKMALAYLVSSVVASLVGIVLGVSLARWIA